MRKFAFLAVPLLLFATTAVSLAQQAAPAVQLGLQQSAQFGAFLTDPNGMTLYTFTGDTSGVSNVSGQLAQVWPPLRPLADRALALPDGVSGTLSVITRADGSPQMAYNGMPLYTFAGDSGPGVVNGQGGDNGQFFVATAQLTAAATETPVVAGATPPSTPEATETPVAAATETETPVAAATETETPVAAATETPVVAGATPAVATPSATATAVATAAVATATPAVLAATPSALPSAGSPSDPAPMAAMLGALALGLLGLGALMRRNGATR